MDQRDTVPAEDHRDEVPGWTRCQVAMARAMARAMATWHHVGVPDLTPFWSPFGLIISGLDNGLKGRRGEYGVTHMLWAIR